MKTRIRVARQSTETGVEEWFYPEYKSWFFWYPIKHLPTESFGTTRSEMVIRKCATLTEAMKCLDDFRAEGVVEPIFEQIIKYPLEQ